MSAESIQGRFKYQRNRMTGKSVELFPYVSAGRLLACITAIAVERIQGVLSDQVSSLRKLLFELFFQCLTRLAT